MYCSHCGGEIPQASKYCKRCGATIAAVEAPPPQILYQNKYSGAAWAMALATTVITLGGLGIVLSAAYSISRPFGPIPINSQLTAITIITIIFGSSAIFGIVALLISFVSRMMGLQSSETNSRAMQENTAVGKLAGEAVPLQLRQPSFPIGSSVTEHTTRTFNDPRYREEHSSDH
ncbi:MAG TPA: zinc ribbon domain-containing protein [Blastocatellia bacterium]|nr:zinc ribbon domain-containing protein [Blastocatellia bacterium]